MTGLFTPNTLLDSVSESTLVLLRPHCERVRLDSRQILVEAGGPVRHVHFVGQGSLAVMTGGDAHRLQIASVGREGMSGASVALGCTHSPFQVVVQAPGWAHRVQGGLFARLCESDSALRNVVLTYCQTLTVQAAETARSISQCNVMARLARWILMEFDRSDESVLRVTHDAVAARLGVRRPGVTVALHMLEGELLIKSRRGALQISNRAGLEAAAAGCYGFSEAHYDRAFSRMGSPTRAVKPPRNHPEEVRLSS